MSSKNYVFGRVNRAFMFLLLAGTILSPRTIQAQKRPGPVDHQLMALYEGSARTLAPPVQLQAAPLRTRDGMVLIDATAAGSVVALEADLLALGLQEMATAGLYCSGWLPIASIGALETLKSLKFVRPSLATTSVGLTTSQGVQALQADDAQALLGLDGSGVKVGVLSDSYDCLGGAAADVASGDLPPGVAVLKEETGCGFGIDEGRAMMQLVHDIAPGAGLAFYTAVDGFADFANGILALEAAGADVIVDDVLYLDEAMFQDDLIAQAADAVVARGAAYFSAAGNQNRDAWEDHYRSSGIPGVFGGIRHDFDPGPGVDDLQRFILATGTTFFSFQWSEPFFSICGTSGCPGGSSSDLDIILYLPGGLFVGLGGFTANIGGDAVEIFGVFNPGPPRPVELGIELFDGPPPAHMKYVFFGPAANTVVDFPTHSGGLYGHANAAGAEAVGAARYTQTPAFGVQPPRVEAFSAAGPTPILFEPDGTPTFALRAKPEVTAPNGTNNTFFGFDFEPDGFPNFFGTSAAAPHAAGAAALLLQADGSLTPDDVYTLLETTAIDMDDPATPGFDGGFDFATGYGLIDAFAAALDALAPLPHNFVMLADKEVKVERQIDSAGDVHSNDKIEFKKGDPSTHTGDLTAVDKIKIDKDQVIKGDALAGDRLDLDRRAVVTGTALGGAPVAPVPLPVLSFAAGGPDVKIDKNGTRALLPGSYGKVEVKEKGTLKLSSGDYFFEELKVKDEGTLAAVVRGGAVRIHAVKKVEFGKGSEVAVAPVFDANSRLLTINSLKDIKVEEDAHVRGNLIAPDGKVELKKDVFFKGAISAEKIDADKQATFVPHGARGGPPLPRPAAAPVAATYQEQGDARLAETPEQVTLAQNYPNPFNPATTIEFSLPASRPVQLAVYDVMGRRVATLVNGVLPAGRHQVRWEAGPVSSGVYFYRIVAGDFVKVKQMLLLK